MNSARLFIVNTLFAMLPPTRLFGVKRSLLRWAGAQIGPNVRIASSARFHLSGDLTIGANSWIGHQVLVVGGDASISIGANVDIAPRVCIETGTHKLFEFPDRAAGTGYSLPIEIHDGVWIGLGAKILPGVRLFESSMVAAGSVVTDDVRCGAVVAGVPAREKTN